MNWSNIFTYKKGLLYWKISPITRIKVGNFAGYFSKPYGYQEVKYQQKEYRAHRIIWEIFKGPIPSGMEIDHIDGDGSNNLIKNLRCVTHQQNICNQKLRTNNQHGQVGIYQKRKRWCARIGVDGKNINLGCFALKAEAKKVRKTAEIKYNFHKNHGRS